MNGIHIFPSVKQALQAGFDIISPYPDGEGFLMARMRASDLWALALVRFRREAVEDVQ